MNGASERRVQLDHFDLVTLGGAFRVCDMSMVLLGHEHAASAVLGSAFAGGAVLCSGRYDFPFRGRFCLPQDWCLIGYVHETGHGSWCHGMELKPGMSMTLLSGGVSEFMLTAGSCWSVALMPVTQLHQKLNELSLQAMDMSVHRMALFEADDGAAGQQLRAGFESVRAHFIDGDTACPDDVGPLLRDHLLAGATGANLPRERRSRGRRMHYRVVRRVEDFMFSNLRSDIDMAQLSSVGCTSERTLRYAFHDVLNGVSPKRYLSLLRLCEACRHLAISDMRRRSVKSVALSCGMWDLSRFVENYRNLFGELPRQTLKRHDNQAAQEEHLRQLMGADRFAWNKRRAGQAG